MKKCGNYDTIIMVGVRMTEMILLDLERKISNNYFKSKDELISYVEEIRKNYQLDMNLFNSKLKELLSLYDKNNTNIDMSNFKDVKLGDNTYIVSGEDYKVLKTDREQGELAEEFREVQNDMIVNDPARQDINADAIFDRMEKYQKESSTMMPLSNLNIEIIDKDMLDKIRFFVQNGNVNIFEYQVDISNGIFFNVNTNELFEVRKNPNTLKYEIYKGGEVSYTNGSNDINNNSIINNISSYTDEELINFQQDAKVSLEVKQTIEEELETRKKLNRPKTRVLKLNPLDNNRAAFIKSSFIIIMLFLSSIMCALLLLLLK